MGGKRSRIFKTELDGEDKFVARPPAVSNSNIFGNIEPVLPSKRSSGSSYQWDDKKSLKAFFVKNSKGLKNSLTIKYLEKLSGSNLQQHSTQKITHGGDFESTPSNCMSDRAPPISSSNGSIVVARPGSESCKALSAVYCHPSSNLRTNELPGGIGSAPRARKTYWLIFRG